MFRVIEFNDEKRLAYCEPFSGNYYTISDHKSNISIISEIENGRIGLFTKSFGDLTVSHTIVGHYLCQFNNHQQLDYEGIKPLTQCFDTEGVWFPLPDNVYEVFERSMNVRNDNDMVIMDFYSGICYTVLKSAQMLTMTTDSDIGCAMIFNNREKKAHICIYDQYVGGMGYSQKAYELLDKIIDAAIRRVQNCRCQCGCPICVGDYKIDRRVVLWGLENIREHSVPPTSIVMPSLPKISLIEKSFSLSTIDKEWDSFRDFILSTGDAYSNFLGVAVKRVELKTVSTHQLSEYRPDLPVQEWPCLVLHGYVNTFAHN